MEPSPLFHYLNILNFLSGLTSMKAMKKIILSLGTLQNHEAAFFNCYSAHFHFHFYLCACAKILWAYLLNHKWKMSCENHHNIMSLLHVQWCCSRFSFSPSFRSVSSQIHNWQWDTKRGSDHQQATTRTWGRQSELSVSSATTCFSRGRKHAGQMGSTTLWVWVEPLTLHFDMRTQCFMNPAPRD